MPPELIQYITQYGYLAIFALVFLQETGAPNPIPNELVLLFSGYLSFTGILKFPLVVLAVVLADFTGSFILHTVFYFFGNYILQHKPRWLPIPVNAIFKLKNRMSKNGLTGIYIGRLSPFIRGYTSVIAGLLQIKPAIFLPIAIVTATIWATVYVMAGRLLGPFWNHIAPNIGNFKYFMLLIFIAIIATSTIRFFMKRKPVKE
ncbi:MAG: DedA family protein [Bacteroidota bacterium]|nr:DedA family protein [Bacteroidota bacterium]